MASVKKKAIREAADAEFARRVSDEADAAWKARAEAVSLAHKDAKAQRMCQKAEPALLEAATTMASSELGQAVVDFACVVLGEAGAAQKAEDELLSKIDIPSFIEEKSEAEAVVDWVKIAQQETVVATANQDCEEADVEGPYHIREEDEAARQEGEVAEIPVVRFSEEVAEVARIAEESFDPAQTAPAEAMLRQDHNEVESDGAPISSKECEAAQTAGEEAELEVVALTEEEAEGMRAAEEAFEEKQQEIAEAIRGQELAEQDVEIEDVCEEEAEVAQKVGEAVDMDVSTEERAEGKGFLEIDFVCFAEEKPVPSEAAQVYLKSFAEETEVIKRAYCEELGGDSGVSLKKARHGTTQDLSPVDNMEQNADSVGDSQEFGIAGAVASEQSAAEAAGTANIEVSVPVDSASQVACENADVEVCHDVLREEVKPCAEMATGQVLPSDHSEEIEISDKVLAVDNATDANLAQTYQGSSPGREDASGAEQHFAKKIQTMGVECTASDRIAKATAIRGGC